MADSTSSLLIDKPGQQGQQYIPVAGGFEKLDQAIAQRTAINELAAGDHVLTDAQFRYAVLAIPVLPATRTLTVPARSKLWLVDNTAGGYAVTVKCAGQPGITVAAGARVVLHCNGVDVVSTWNHLAALDSPALTGTPTAPTPATNDDSTRIATTAYVVARLAALIDSAPGALDTLNELAAALGDDEDFAATVTAALAGKASIAQALPAGGTKGQSPRKLSSTDYDTGWGFEAAEIVAAFAGHFRTANSGAYGNNGGQFVLSDPYQGISPVWSAETGTSSTTGASEGVLLEHTSISANRGLLQLSTLSRLELSARVAIPTLSTVGEAFLAYWGFSNAKANAGTAPTTGGFFRINGSSLEFVSAASGSETLFTWGTPLTAATWYQLSLAYTSSAIQFYVNGALVQTINTGLPLSSSLIRDSAQMVKSAGTTNRQAHFNNRLIRWWY